MTSSAERTAATTERRLVDEVSARRLSAATPPGVGLGHAQTVPRHLVHRCAVAEVFITSLDRGPDGTYLIGAQLPRGHAYYGDHTGPHAGRHDPLAVMEVGRQAAIAVSHTFFGAPLDSAYLVRAFNGADSSGVETAGGATPDPWEIGSAPADLEITLTVDREHEMGGVRCGLDTTLDIRRVDGSPLMRVDGSFTWVTPEQWAHTRRGASASTPVPHVAPIDSERVWRESRRNVAIGEPRPAPVAGAVRTSVVVDPSHPTLFDHPLDHVPGTLLLEAARQSALVSAGENAVRVRGVRSSFGRFVERGRLAECITTITGRSDAGGGAGKDGGTQHVAGIDHVSVIVQQLDRVCAEIEVDVETAG